MRVLLTGASSFTGLWIARALHALGCEIVASCRGPAGESGDQLRDERIRQLKGIARVVGNAPFGGPGFHDLVRTAEPFDLVILHGADVGNFRNPGYDPLGALAANTRDADLVFSRLAARGTRRVVVTGTVFEADEGEGNAGRPAIGRYGLAKTLSWQVLRFAAERAGLAVGKFVIANPFGPWQKPNLVSFLIESWLAGRVPEIRQPDLVRDHIHVDLMAARYARFALDMPEGPALLRCAPQGYVEPLRDFAERLAVAMRPRLDRPCLFTCVDPPPPIDEPLVRHNTGCATAPEQDWPFDASWDALAVHCSTAAHSPI